MKTMERFSTLFAILLIFSISIHVGHVQNAVANEADWMPDANLRTAVRTSLGLADNEDLTQAKMLDLTELKAAGRGISNLTGLEYATNVTIVKLAGNQILNISPLSGLTSVTKLRLQGNEITNIASLSGLTDLTELFLNDNQITDVTPLTNLVNLVKLRLAGNSLTNAHLLSSLTKLTDVDITIPSPPDTEAPGVSISVPSGTQTGAFSVTITFTESVSGFTQSDLSLSGTASASITGWSTTDNTTYTATITPTSSGSVTLNINADVATDAANNPNTAATLQTVTVNVDTESPDVTVSVPSGVQNGAFSVTITFTETVSGFTQSDVSLNGSAASITAWSANSNNTIYTATITPTASGTVTIGVAANVATDAANNQNTAATSKNVTVDVDKPTVNIGVPSGTQTGAFDATITFTEAVSGFVGSDVSLSGSAASITGWSTNSDDTVYTVTITPTASGTVTIGVAANVATDAAGNNNTAATSKNVTVSVDTNAPGVSIAVPSGVQNGAFNVTITFTEAVSGFVGSDVSLTGSASSITSWSANSDDTVYTATITPTASGTVTIGVAANVATDAANNQNTAATSQTVTVDVDKPSVTIGVPSGTRTGVFDATITFSETVSGFAQSDVSLTGSAASVTSWSANSDDTVYTVTITPTASGTVTIGVAANVATDAANNQNTAATSKTVTVNIPALVPDPATWMPDANLRAAVRSALGIASNANFSKADLSTLTTFRAVQSQISNLTGLEHATNLTSLVAFRNQISSLTPLENLTSLTEIRMGNNDISDVTPLDDLTSLTKLGLQHNNISNVTPLAGLVNLTWLRLAGNSITDLSPLVTLVNVTDSDVDLPEPDTTAPGVTVSVPSGAQNGAFSVSITFTEAVSDFVQSDVSLSGSAASITSWNANSDDTVYTATITPTASGTVTIGVAANVATDAANNQNTAATSKNVTVSLDTTAPGVSISVPSGKQNGAFDATITFTETVSGFEQADASLSGSAASITSWSANSDNTVYTATVTPTVSGTVTIGVAANVATDGANNQNTAATSISVTVDVDKPTVTIGVPSGTQNGAFSVTITFTETVSGFVQSDVSLSGSAASVTSWSANGEATVYTATITPTVSGTVTIGVAANVATDAANNQNTVATSQSVIVTILDTTQPSATISVETEHVTSASHSVHVNSPFKITITFTEPVSDFEQSDILLYKGRVEISNFNASDPTTYTADITPAIDEDNRYLSIVIPAGAATDAAGNPNRQEVSPNVYIDMERPTPYLTVPTSDVTTETFTVTIKFADEPNGSGKQQYGFEQSDLSLDNNTAGATVTGWSSGTDHITTATITVTKSGSVTFRVAEGVAADSANNSNTASLLKTVTVRLPGSDPPESTDTDTTQPSATISVETEHVTSASHSVHVNSPFKITITFTEPVSNFEQSDILLEYGRAEISSFSTTDTKTYTADITPAIDEDNRYLSIVIPAGAATDAAGNSNYRAASRKVYIDMERPTPYLTVPTSDVTTETFTVTIKFADEPNGSGKQQYGFEQSDLSLTNNTAGATVTGWSSGTDHITTATITVTKSGSVTFGVAEGVATDSANNSNTASLLKTVTVRLPGSDPPESTDTDTTQPSATISVETEHVTSASHSVHVNSPFKITITFTEPVSNFEQSDILLNRGRAEISNFSASYTADGGSDTKTYTADVTPAIDEDNRYLNFVIPAGAATDAAGNPNYRAASRKVYIDMERPTLYLTVPTSDVTTETFTVTIRFADEPIWGGKQPYGFEQSDLSLTNNTAGATVTGWSSGTDHITTATITVTQSGSVTFRVAEGVATDSANNSNTASLLKTVTVALPNAAPLANGNGPDQTLLHPNYPNPFNPETWIPYHLANDTDVQISIYDVNGALVRQLNLGYQQAGYYTNRSRAAYWDGRNEFGERVATGIYFYQLKADNMSLIRKMVILK